MFNPTLIAKWYEIIFIYLTLYELSKKRLVRFSFYHILSFCKLFYRSIL